ncbi:hypothetical protein ACLUXN_08645, partial [Limosilactobacillus reuteri subsp. suis]|uniref:hypothetical protein n=1 Tax=Limosilactobacillus reuteri TaxID=1598 RepID=UPI0039955EA2
NNKKQKISNTKQMLLKFTSNTNGENIKVKYIPSIADRFGAIVSLISWISFMGYAVLKSRLLKPKKENF